MKRKDFVKICTKCIQETRKDLTIRNQKSGYLKYHREIKENHYFTNCRDIRNKHADKFGYSLFEQYEVIKKSRMGNCNELAEYLSVKIIECLKKEDVYAEVNIVESNKADHVYLQINILLEDEKDFSVWEIDAWDPRLIDVSTRPDWTIKNKKALDYGTSPGLVFSVTTREFKRRKICNSTYMAIREPEEGRPLRDATPERDVVKKHKNIYRDYSLEDAYKERKLDKYGEIHFLQRKSSWQ